MRIAEAARETNAIWIAGNFGMRPPQFGGDVVGDRLDVVTHMHGLGSFSEEVANSHSIDVDGIQLRCST